MEALNLIPAVLLGLVIAFVLIEDKALARSKQTGHWIDPIFPHH